jgi:hypothetical protein
MRNALMATLMSGILIGCFTPTKRLYTHHSLLVGNASDDVSSCVKAIGADSIQLGD